MLSENIHIDSRRWTGKLCEMGDIASGMKQRGLDFVRSANPECLFEDQIGI